MADFGDKSAPQSTDAQASTTFDSVEHVFGAQGRLYRVKNATGVRNAIREGFRKGAGLSDKSEADTAVNLAFVVLRKLGDLNGVLKERLASRLLHSDCEHAVHRIGQVLLHKELGFRCVVIGWRITPQNQQECTVLVDEFDANQIGGHAAAQQIRADRLQPVPGYLTRIYHEDINKYFSEYDSSLNRFVPVDDLIFEYPDDFDPVSVTASTVTEVVEAGGRVLAAAKRLDTELRHILEKHGISPCSYDTVHQGVLKDVLKGVAGFHGRVQGQLYVVPTANTHTHSYRGVWSTRSEDSLIDQNFELYTATNPRSMFPAWAEPSPLELLSLQWWRGYSVMEGMADVYSLIEALLTSRHNAATNTETLFQLGQIVTHTRFGYRGVVCGYDKRPLYNASSWEGVLGLPSGQEQPFYRVIPDEADVRDFLGQDAWRPFLYVAQENLELTPLEKSVVHHRNIPLVFKHYDAVNGVFEPLPQYKFSYPKRVDGTELNLARFAEDHTFSDAHVVLEQLYRAVQEVLLQAREEGSALLDDLHTMLRCARRREDAAVIEALIWIVWMTHKNPKIQQLMHEGVLELKRGRHEAAEEYFEAAFQLDPSYSEATNKMAVSHIQSQNYSECLHWTEMTIKLNPRHYGAHAGAGRSSIKLGRKEEAKRHLVHTLQLHPWAAHVPSELLSIERTRPPEPFTQVATQEMDEIPFGMLMDQQVQEQAKPPSSHELD